MLGLAITLTLTAAVVILLPSPAAASDEAVVTKLVDGDTLDVSIDGRTERIRMLNIDTPETKSPDQTVQCLGPEAASFLASMVPVGTTIRLEYDEERQDRFDRTLAAVFTSDGTLVNAEIARAGLARSVVFDGNDRFLAPVQSAQKEAAANARGLYSPTIACTLPAQVEAVTAAAEAVAASPQDPAASSAELEGAAAEAAAATAAAAALVKQFSGDRKGLVWESFSAVDQDRLLSRVTAAMDGARGIESKLAAAASDARKREAEAARAAAEAEAARVAAEKARKAEEQRESTQAAREAEAERESAQAAKRAGTSKPKAAAADPAPKRAAAPENPYPGYTGPRCYAPGGKTWKPCP